MKKCLIITACATAAVGCAWIPSVGPNYEEPQFDIPLSALPDAGYPSSNMTANCEYQKANEKEDNRIVISNDQLSQWWNRFNDPIMVSLVDSAVTNNLSYQMAIQRLEKANYELLGSYAAFLPKFAGNAAWTRNWFGENTPSGLSYGKFYQYNAQRATLDGSWEIDIFGGSRRQSQAALAQAEAAGWNVADAWVSLTTLIGQQYINLRTTQTRIEVARTNLVLQSETYDILKSRLDSGIGDELAVNQCAYVVERTRAQIPALLAQEEALKNSIAILAGKVPGELHELLKPVTTKRDWLLAPQKVGELKLNMLRARPDVKRAERELAAQTAMIGVAKAAWYPKFYINGSVGWQNNNSYRLFDKDSFISTLGPSVSWPIFQGGAIYANVKATEAKLKEASLAYQLAVETAYGEVRDAYSAYSQEYHRYKSLSAAVKAATDAVTISKDLYKNGLKDFNNVLDAQRSRLQLEEEFVISRGQITLNLITLYKTLGGGLATSDEK